MDIEHTAKRVGTNTQQIIDDRKKQSENALGS